MKKRFTAIRPMSEQASSPEVLAASGVPGGGGPAITELATKTNARESNAMYAFEYFMIFSSFGF